MDKIYGKLISLFLCINHIRADTFKECHQVTEGTFVAIEKNCLAYIYCRSDNSFVDLCPMGTFFDQQLQQCTEDIFLKCANNKAAIVDATAVEQQGGATAQQVSTASVSASAQYNATSATLSGSSIAITETMAELNSVKLPTTLSHRPHCKPSADEYFSSPLRCEYYYECSHGFLSILRCNFGYGWDFLLEKCLPLKDAQCYRTA